LSTGHQARAFAAGDLLKVLARKYARYAFFALARFTGAARAAAEAVDACLVDRQVAAPVIVWQPASSLTELPGEFEMPISSQAFDSYLEAWKRAQAMPWNLVRQKVEISNLLRHVGQSGLKILDAGGGNGYASIPFAQNGCRVVVADYSEAMLADGQKLMSELGLDKLVSFVLARLEDLSSAIHDQDFDVVMCHNVLPYVESIPIVLRSILQPLKSQGVVSIICMNRYSIAYHQAFLRGDLQAAKAAIGATETNTILLALASPALPAPRPS
jgi:ubiquinone/menaquinone biosynthesis C-methylase UbiE